jgi:hypothetical protein
MYEIFYVLEAVAVNSTALYVVTWCSLVYIFADFSEERINMMIYLLTAIGLSPGGSTHLHTKTIHRTTQITTEQHK